MVEKLCFSFKTSINNRESISAKCDKKLSFTFPIVKCTYRTRNCVSRAVSIVSERETVFTEFLLQMRAINLRIIHRALTHHIHLNVIFKNNKNKTLIKFSTRCVKMRQTHSTTASPLHCEELCKNHTQVFT